MKHMPIWPAAAASAFALAAAVASTSIPATAWSQAAMTAAPPAEVSIPNSRRIDFISKANGHAYSISVALPLTPPPAEGYGVLYVLDGYGYSASATEAVRGNGNAPGVIVVGVGYPQTPAFISAAFARHAPPAGPAATPTLGAAVHMERMYDLTLPSSDATLAVELGPTPTTPAKDVGGMDDFLKMIEVEVKPRVDALAPVDHRRQALFGHSLGGLAVVRALFTEPGAFATFIAASPSIWWNSDAVLAGEPKFSAAVTSGQAAPRVLVTVGADEGPLMVDAARGLAARLQRLHGSPGYKVGDVAVFPDQGHGISPWPAIGRAVSFAFPQN